MYMII